MPLAFYAGMCILRSISISLWDLSFSKYLSDTFEAHYTMLKAEGEGFEEDKDAYFNKEHFLEVIHKV
jgi:hypothetical protein